MGDSRASRHLEVQAFLILERLAGSNEFLISVLLQAEGEFIGKTSLGTVAEGQELLLSLRWDQPQQHFVVSSESAEGKPVLAFIPFASSGTDRLPFPPDSQWRKFRAETRWERRRRDHEKQPSITLSQRLRCEKEFKWASP